MDKKVKEMFLSREIDFQLLAETFPDIADYFRGTNPGKINRYDNGVMSIVIEGQGKESPSTFGYLPVGDFVFNVGGNQETMHLSGSRAKFRLCANCRDLSLSLKRIKILRLQI